MNKVITTALFLVFLIVILTYNIYNAKINVFNFLSINNNISKLVVLNKDFNLFLTKNTNYDNFDHIKHKMQEFNEIKQTIYSNKLLNKINNIKLKQSLTTLDNVSNEKFAFMQYFKSYRAILNNSYLIIKKLNRDIISESLLNYYIKILTLNINNISDIEVLEHELELLKEIEDNYTNNTDLLFIAHSKIILKYQVYLFEIKEELFELDLNSKLNNLQNIYEINSTNEIEKEKVFIVFLVLILIFLIIIYLIYEYKLDLTNKNLSKFRITLENSDNIIMIVNKDKYITYVNNVFTKVTGYSQKEALGEKVDFLKSNKLSDKFYQNLHNTLNSGKKWHGELINTHKNGQLIYERVTITPSLDSNGNVLEYILIKLDITNEVLANIKLKENEKMLNNQSKMAAMGEMLENISHQWRQPLSLVSTTATSLMLEKELNLSSNKEEELKKLTSINNTIQFLSQTISDFKDFFNPNKEKELFNLKDTYIKTQKLLYSKLDSVNIVIIENIEDVQITNFKNEIMQVLINILNNAKDALQGSNNSNKYIFVDIHKINNEAVITIKDNAGGIPDKIINNVFDPYFTTKHKAQGTGIGLYMSQEIISKHMHGILFVENTTYIHENVECKGALFTIKIPT